MELIRNSAQTIGTTAVQVVPELLSGERKVINITNTSTSGQIISLSWGSQAVASSGVVLYPGGSWSESNDVGFVASNLSIWAVSSGVSGTLAIHERINPKNK